VGLRHDTKTRGALVLTVFVGVAIALVAGVVASYALLVRAQDACRRSAAHFRLTREARDAARQMYAELPQAGNIRISPDGMAMTFQVPVSLDMLQLRQYVAHGAAPPAPLGIPWVPWDVNKDGLTDSTDSATKDGHRRTLWGTKEPAGSVWGNFMCYRFEYLDGNGNGVPDAADCLDESVIRMDLNDNGRTDETFLPGRLVRFSTTQGDPGKHPERQRTSLCTPLVSGRSWVVVRWDKKRSRIAPPDRQDIDGDGQPDGPIFREMVHWPSKPLDHPLRTPPDSAPGLWDVWRDCPRAQYRQPSIIMVDLWQLRVTVDKRHFLHHVRAAVKRRRV